MFSTPAVVGSVVCVGSCVGMFYALDRATGQPRGQHDVFSADRIGSDTGEGDTAYVFAFDWGTAKVRWRRPMGPGVMSDIARWKDWRYAVTLRDELVCFAPASGAPHWSYRPESPVRNDRTSSPVVVGDRVAYADRDGIVRAFEAETGRVLWRAPQIDPVTTWLVVADSSLMFMRGADTLVRLDPVTGRERRNTLVAGGPYSGPITVVGDSLLLLLGSQTLTAFDLRHDRVRWSHSATHEWTSSRPYVWRDMALGGESGRLVAYGLADGTARWTHTMDGMVRGIGTYGDTLYVGTFKGQVHALVDPGGRSGRHN